MFIFILTSLVEAADLYLAGEGDPEGLRAEDEHLGQGDERRVDGQRQLDGELRRHHRRQDEGALKEQLVAVAIGVGGA